MDHPLERPIWSALTTRQAHLAEVDGRARRFPPAVTALAALAAPTDEAWRALAGLLAADEVAGVLLDEAPALPAELELVEGAPCAQMVQASPGMDVAPLAGTVTLGASDAADMLELASRTRPGPFGPRTHELGGFLGVRDGGRLIAMSGERMRVPGMIEISGVCTDPGFAGRGLAAMLVAACARRIRAAGEQPFLHVRASNARAIALYQRLGFVERARLGYAVVRRRR